VWWEWVIWAGEASQAPLIWSLGAAAVLWGEAFFRHEAAPAFRRFFLWLVGFQALLLFFELTFAAGLSLGRRYPSDFLTGAAIFNVAAWFLVGGASWPRLMARPHIGRAKPTPLEPHAARGCATLCMFFGVISGLCMPALMGGVWLPTLHVASDRVLVESFRKATESNDGERFTRTCAELSRRPTDRSHTFEAAAREFRLRSGRSNSLSAVLEGYVAANAWAHHSEDWLGTHEPPRRQRIVEAPELAAIRVLSRRGEMDEVTAWLVDPQVPSSLKQSVLRERQSPATVPP
jgi:hypothetical protein